MIPCDVALEDLRIQDRDIAQKAVINP